MAAVPEVSVVIPSQAGATLERAVETALAQVGVSVEVLVVLNGARRAVSFDDPRVRVLTSDPEDRGNGARAVGIAEAAAPYIALLDDDDYWHPEKLRRQLAVARASGDAVVVSCGLEERRADGTPVRTSPRHPEIVGPVREHLFLRRTLVSNLPQLQTSTLLFPAALGRAVPFDPALTYHQDWSWLLRAEDFGASFVQLPQALTYRELTGTGSVGGRISWNQSTLWALENVVDDRLIGDFLLVMALPKALRRDDLEGARSVLRLARDHRPGAAARVHASITLARWSVRRVVRVPRRTDAAPASASPARTPEGAA